MNILIGAALYYLAVTSSPAALIGHSTPIATALTASEGQRDFDWEIGKWKTELRRLKRPLTGSTEWLEYSGTTLVSPIWGGQANLVELDVAGPAGKIRALSLRLYNPNARQWTLNFANSMVGEMSLPPATGQFKNGRGEFLSHEKIGNRMVLVRFIISEVTQTSAKFEQAYSDDGGKTWEVNWIARDTRIAK